MRRNRKAKIAATIGPSSSTPEKIDSLLRAGVDVFRLNFSHGSHEDHAQRIQIIRSLEQKYNVPTTILIDLQGPKLRIGTFGEGYVFLKPDDIFTLDLIAQPGDSHRVNLPHPEIFAALVEGTILMLDDGKIRLEVLSCKYNLAKTRVINGGELSNRKGVNVPNVALPISAITKKDRADLDFALSQNIDWVALSFVQTPQDILEAREIIQSKAKIMAKLEKPLAIQHLETIIDFADGIMVARGDLGVELPIEEVPSIQKQIIRSCRKKGKPVIVATQMLDSMVFFPSPTRAEASDVATAIYDGVDVVMLSAESASGKHPIESVEMMQRIICHVEKDPLYLEMMNSQRPHPNETVADAIVTAARQVSQTIHVPTIVTFTETGSTTLRAARERPEAFILALTPNNTVARQLGLIWGVYALQTEEVFSFSQMVETACEKALHEKFATIDEKIIVIAGVPFAKAGGTNILRIVRLGGDITPA